ncbi:MAG: hypothetical protein ABL925_02935 [Methylococcales bacterium]
MKKFNIKIVLGTMVKLFGITGMHPVKNVHETKQWITVIGVPGKFERDKEQRYSNSTITYEEEVRRARECRLFNKALINNSHSLTNTVINVHVNQLNNTTKRAGDRLHRLAAVGQLPDHRGTFQFQ